MCMMRHLGFIINKPMIGRHSFTHTAEYVQSHTDAYVPKENFVLSNCPKILPANQNLYLPTRIYTSQSEFILAAL